MDEQLSQRLEEWQQALLDMTESFLPDSGDTQRVDVHVHLGIDAGTGSEMTLEAIERQARMARIDRDVLIPLNASDGYRIANRRLAEVARESDGRYEFLARVDPSNAAASEVERMLDDGAAGIKLHPHSDGARPGDPRIRGAIEAVAERSRLVLVHAGIDVDGVSDEIMDVAAAVPDAHFVIGHPSSSRTTCATTRRSCAAGSSSRWTCTRPAPRATRTSSRSARHAWRARRRSSCRAAADVSRRRRRTRCRPGGSGRG